MVSRRALTRAIGPLGALCLVAALGGCAGTAAVHATATATTVPPTPTLPALATATRVPPTPTSIALGWTTYQDEQYFFSLQVPMSGHFVSTDAGYYSVMFQLAPANGDVATLWVGIAGGLTTLEQQFCSSAKTTSVAGFPAVAADSNQSAGATSGAAMLERLFVARGLFYVVQLMSPQTLDQLRQRLGPLYAQILASFQPGPGQPGNVICAS